MSASAVLRPLVHMLDAPARPYGGDDGGVRRALGRAERPLDLDDDLLREAARRVHAASKTALIELALQALIRESARTRLVEAGGTMPDIEGPARRKAP